MGHVFVALLLGLIFAPRSAASAEVPGQDEWTVVEETRLVGTINGTLKQGDVLWTESSNVYKVVGPTLEFARVHAPAVRVLKKGHMYRLIVAGLEDPIECVKLRDVIKSFVRRVTTSPSDGVTVFWLTNGQAWQQLSYEYVFSDRFNYGPEAVVYSAGGHYWMKIDDVDEAFPVMRRDGGLVN